MICSFCYRPLVWVNEWGRYIHENGGAIMQYCETCHKSASYERPKTKCPICSEFLKDSHLATPKMCAV
jgi:Zn-finger protein